MILFFFNKSQHKIGLINKQEGTINQFYCLKPHNQIGFIEGEKTNRFSKKFNTKCVNLNKSRNYIEIAIQKKRGRMIN
jgi:hypothetical protein